MSKWECKVRKITEIKPHENADKLEIARVDGFEWDIIIGKDQFKVGSLAIYVPIESILPEELMNIVFKDTKVKPSKGRIKTIKIRQKYSYGLLLDPILLQGKKDGNRIIHLMDIKNGMDVADILEIKKYEPPEPSYSTRSQFVKKKLQNPHFREYTDIEHLRYYPNTFGYPNEDGSIDDVVIMEKIHGTNFRAGWLPRRMDNWFQKIWGKIVGEYEFVVGSRHVQQKFFGGKTWLEQKGLQGSNVYIEMTNRLRLKEIIPKDYVIYGEIYGKGIQDLNYGMDDIGLVVFDVMYRNPYTGEESYLDYHDLKKFCEQHGFVMPAVLYHGKFVQDCSKHAEGKTLLGTNPEQIREGCVIRPEKDRHNSLFGRTILKCINNEYLVREQGTEFH